MNVKALLYDRRGLTLIELMIVLVLSLLLMSAVYMTFQVQKSTADVQHEVAAIQQDLRAVIDIMARDIRHAGCDPTLYSTAGLFPSQTGPAAIAFSMDLDGDGGTGGTDEVVTYALSGNDLTRNGALLAQNVTTLGFTFFDSDNNEITPTGSGGSALTSDEADDVRFITLRIQVQSDKKDPDTKEFLYRTMDRRIKLRNVGL